MSSKKSFPFLSLPVPAMESVFKQSYKIDLVNLMFTSEHLLTILTSMRFKSSCLKIFVDSCDFYVILEFSNESKFTWEVSTKELDRHDIHRYCREPVGTIKIRDTVLKYNYMISASDKLITSVAKDDRYIVFKMIIEHLLSIVKVEKVNLSLNPKPISDQLDDFLAWKPIQKLDSLKLTGGTDHQRKKVLDAIEMDCLALDCVFKKPHQHEKLLTVPKLYVTGKHILTKETVLLRNQEHTSYGRPIDLTENNFVEYIRHWLRGGYENMKMLQLRFRGPAAPMFNAALAHFRNQWKKYPMNFRPRFYQISYNLLCNMLTVVYLERADGKRLNMFYGYDDFIWLFTLDEGTPEFKVPTGMRRYCRGYKKDFYRVLMPLKPLVLMEKTEV